MSESRKKVARDEFFSSDDLDLLGDFDSIRSSFGDDVEFFLGSDDYRTRAMYDYHIEDATWTDWKDEVKSTYAGEDKTDEFAWVGLAGAGEVELGVQKIEEGFQRQSQEMLNLAASGAIRSAEDLRGGSYRSALQNNLAESLKDAKRSFDLGRQLESTYEQNEKQRLENEVRARNVSRFEAIGTVAGAALGSFGGATGASIGAGVGRGVGTLAAT